jgi:thiamine biosynthesis lipoprotein
VKTKASLFILLLVLFHTAHLQAQAPIRKWTFTQPKMGSPFSIVVYSNDSIQVAASIKKAYLLVDSLNSIYSDYDLQSELSVLSQKGESPKVSNALWDILEKSQYAFSKSNGTFDVSIASVVRL